MKTNKRTYIETASAFNDKIEEDKDIIDKICTDLFQSERYFLRKGAIDSDGSVAEINKFLQYVAAAAVTFTETFSRIEANYKEWLALIDDFEQSNGIACRFVLCWSQCDAELRDQKCALSRYSRQSKVRCNTALNSLKGMYGALGEIGQIVGDFTSEYDLSGGAPCNLTYCQLQNIIRYFMALFSKAHWKGHIYYNDLRRVGDELTISLNSVTDCP